MFSGVFKCEMKVGGPEQIQVGGGDLGSQEMPLPTDHGSSRSESVLMYG